MSFSIFPQEQNKQIKCPFFVLQKKPFLYNKLK